MCREFQDDLIDTLENVEVLESEEWSEYSAAGVFLEFEAKALFSMGHEDNFIGRSGFRL